MQIVMILLIFLSHLILWWNMTWMFGNYGILDILNFESCFSLRLWTSLPKRFLETETREWLRSAGISWRYSDVFPFNHFWMRNFWKLQARGFTNVRCWRCPSVFPAIPAELLPRDDVLLLLFSSENRRVWTTPLKTHRVQHLSFL